MILWVGYEYKLLDAYQEKKYQRAGGTGLGGLGGLGVWVELG